MKEISLLVLFVLVMLVVFSASIIVNQNKKRTENKQKFKLLFLMISILYTVFIVLITVFAIKSEPENILYYRNQKLEAISYNHFINNQVEIIIKVENRVFQYDVLSEGIIIIEDESLNYISIDKGYVKVTYDRNKTFNDEENIANEDLAYIKFVLDYHSYSSYMDEFPEGFIYSIIGIIALVLGLLSIACFKVALVTKRKILFFGVAIMNSLVTFAPIVILISAIFK